MLNKLLHIRFKFEIRFYFVLFCDLHSNVILYITRITAFHVEKNANSLFPFPFPFITLVSLVIASVVTYTYSKIKNSELHKLVFTRQLNDANILKTLNFQLNTLQQHYLLYLIFPSLTLIEYNLFSHQIHFSSICFHLLQFIASNVKLNIIFFLA